MTAALCTLSDVVTALGLTGHLDECDHQHLSFPLCSWCRWALSTEEIETLHAARSDARALRGSGASDTVPWIVAVLELVRLVSTIDVEAIVVPSARAAAATLRDEVIGDVRCLRRRVDAAVASGGPVERRCLLAAGPVAAAAVQEPRHRDVLDALPDPIRRRLADLSNSLSTQVQLAGLLPLVDDMHRADLPTLTTQPEWTRRPAAGSTAGIRARQLNRTNLTPGSLEDFVVESLMEQVTHELLDMGDRLTSAAPPVAYRRPADEAPVSSRTRSTMWRVAGIDWNRTFVDSGRAECWDARIEGDVLVTDVPWQVAVAMDAAESCGLVSATHAG